MYFSVLVLDVLPYSKAKDSPMISSLSFLYSFTFKIEDFNPSGFRPVFSVWQAHNFIFSPYCQSVPPRTPPPPHPATAFHPFSSGFRSHLYHALTFRAQKVLFLGSLFRSVGSSAVYVSVTAVFITEPLGSLLIPQRPEALLCLFETEPLEDIFFQIHYRISWLNSLKPCSRCYWNCITFFFFMVV